MEYVVIIPAKNEEEFIAQTLESLAAQTHRPVRCIVMNDGSTDGTGAIVEEFSRRLPFLTHQVLEGSASYTLGGKVVQVFNRGKRLLDEQGVRYDVIVKLDADTSFEPHVAAALLKRMSESNLGIASGTPYFSSDGHKLYDYSPHWHTHGQFKFYRRETLERIGGLRESLGWDTADNVHAMDAGYETKAFRDIEYQMHRQVGGKGSVAKGRRNHGRGAFLLGYDPAYFALRVLHDVVKPPQLVGSFELLRGYLEAPRADSPLFTTRQRRLLRRLLWGGLGKRLIDRDFALLQRLRLPW
jgi:glycosyltransferase involved in cell wall biosynthesis